MKTCIKIAGAGPAGLAAAIHLAKRGYPVEIFEARETVGGRFIGDFQVIENASRSEDVCDLLKRIGISSRFFFKPLYRATFYDAQLRPTPVKSHSPYGYFIRRGPGDGTLDSGLLAQAIEAGATVSFGKRIKAEQADIVATGPAVADGLAKEMTFRTALPDTISVLFDMNVSPGGYSYLFVLEGEGTFGCAITRDFDHIDVYFQKALDRFRRIAPFSTQSEKIAYSFMNFCIKPSAAIENRLYVGEAAGFQDYLFGLGIRYALLTGFAAAESLIRKEDYDRLWKQEIGLGQETSLVNRSLYELGGNMGLNTFIRQAGRDDLQGYLNKWHRPNGWKKRLLPFVKWFLQEKGTCHHRAPRHWCRIRPKSVSKTELGPLKASSDAKNPEEQA
ncbi:MAG: NAD(P)/FAD-dependent oxidoreductase [Nitrospiria bacterium]